MHSIRNTVLALTFNNKKDNYLTLQEATIPIILSLFYNAVSRNKRLSITELNPLRQFEYFSQVIFLIYTDIFSTAPRTAP